MSRAERNDSRKKLDDQSKPVGTGAITPRDNGDATQIHEWARLIVTLFVAVGGGLWASHGLKETLNDQKEILEASEALNGSLSTTFQVREFDFEKERG